MNITCIVTDGMTPQEKEIYLRHMEMRHKQEVEKINAEREILRAYKQSLIEDIIKERIESDLKYLNNLSVRSLERILYGM